MVRLRLNLQAVATILHLRQGGGDLNGLRQRRRQVELVHSAVVEAADLIVEAFERLNFRHADFIFAPRIENKINLHTSSFGHITLHW